MLANTEDNSDTGELELIRHLHVNVSSLKILLQGTIFDMNVHVFENMIFREFCLCHCCLFRKQSGIQILEEDWSASFSLWIGKGRCISIMEERHLNEIRIFLNALIEMVTFLFLGNMELG